MAMTAATQRIRRSIIDDVYSRLIQGGMTKGSAILEIASCTGVSFESAESWVDHKHVPTGERLELLVMMRNDLYPQRMPLMVGDSKQGSPILRKVPGDGPEKVKLGPTPVPKAKPEPKPEPKPTPTPRAKIEYVKANDHALAIAIGALVLASINTLAIIALVAGR